MIELGRAVGAECLARAQMPAAETKPMHEVVTPLIHSPDKEDPPAFLATLVDIMSRRMLSGSATCRSSHPAQGNN